jgi:hypothetical protein
MLILKHEKTIKGFNYMRKIFTGLLLLLCMQGYSQQINYAEYFIDNAVAVGSGTPISIGTPADSINININIPSTGLAAGFHSLNIRVRYNNGIWGMLENRIFYVKPIQDNVVSPKIAKAEYFFDNDTLGVGKRTVISTGSLADSVSINNNISTTGLSAGFHSLSIRTQDSAGTWGMLENRVFYINQSNFAQNAPKIVSAEYYYNTDPGMGNGTAISPSFATADSINLNRNMLTTGLPSGIDTLYVRVKDSIGMWSLPFSKSFRICAAAPNAPTVNGNTIFNVCNGGNTSFSATPASGASIFWRGPNGFTATSNTVNLTNITNLKTGTYFAYSVTGATACDTSSAATVIVSISTPISQSLTVNGALVFCQGDSVTLSIPTQSGNSYRWLRNGNNTTNNSDTLNSLVVKTSGTYNVKVTNASGCFANMRDTIVTVSPKPNTTIIGGNANVLVNSTNTYSVTNTTASTYSWNVTNGTINSGAGTNSISVTWPATAGTGSVKVIETNANGCKGDTVSLLVSISSVTLTVNPNSVNATSSASSNPITVTSNSSWTASSNQTWATLSSSSGTGNTVVNILLTVNSSQTARTAIVTFTAGSLTQTLTITQAGSVADVFSFSADTTYIPNTTNNFTENINSNRSWTLSINQTWANVSPLNGLGNGTINITTSANTGSARTAIISATAGTISKKFVIIQDGITGVNEINQINKISIYPNPTSGLVTISSTQTIANIEVFDVTGKLVYNLVNNSKQTNTSLDLSALSNGIYFINAVTENGGISKSKVVVSK